MHVHKGIVSSVFKIPFVSIIVFKPCKRIPMENIFAEFYVLISENSFTLKLMKATRKHSSMVFPFSES